MALRDIYSLANMCNIVLQCNSAVESTNAKDFLVIPLASLRRFMYYDLRGTSAATRISPSPQLATKAKQPKNY